MAFEKGETVVLGVIEYRSGGVADAARLQAVQRDASGSGQVRDWAAWVENRPPFNRPGCAKRIEVAEVGGDIVGFAACRHGSHAAGFEADLTGLFVLPGHQRTGIGSELIRRIALWLEADGLSSISVDVIASNPAVGFYEALGGEVVSRWYHEVPCVTMGISGGQR